MPTGVVRNDVFLDHRPPGYHPENPQRLKVIYELLDEIWNSKFMDIPLREATEDEILSIHTKPYLEEVKDTLNTSGHFDADTYYSKNSYKTALLAVGSVLNAVDAIVSRKVKNAFAFIRPPGHHAERDRAMGFCIFNNVAIAARYAQKKHGIARVLIVDWDLHHGNGTQWAFYSDPTVLYFSTHQYPYYPGTGAINECGTNRGEGYNINVPLPAGTGDGDYIEIFNRILMPVCDGFKPEFIIVSAGFDAHKSDPLGGMELSEKGFAALTSILKGIAKKYSDERLLLVLEGGYNLEALKNSCAQVLQVLQGNEPDIKAAPTQQGLEIIEKIIKFFKAYWKNL